MDRHLPIPRSTWILLFVLPPLGWWLLSRGNHSPARRMVGYVASGTFVGMVIVGQIMEKPPEHNGARGAVVEPPSTPSEAAPTPPDSPVAASDRLCAVVPSALDGFALVSVQGPLVTAPRCGSVDYEPVGDSPFSIALFVRHPNTHSIEEEIGTAGTAVAVGPHAARLTRSADTSEIGIHWKQGDWFFTVFARPLTDQSRGAREAALQAATAVAEWATPAIGGMPPDVERARMVALEAALVSDASADALSGRSFRRMTGQAPEWVESIALEQGTLILTVAPAWQRLPAAVRESQATAVWRDWARINTPSDLDDSVVEFRDRAGERLGGSGILGSMISMSE